MDSVIWGYLNAAVSIVLNECRELPIEAILLDGSLCVGDGIVWQIRERQHVMSDIDLIVLSSGRRDANAVAQQRVNQGITQLLPEVAVDVWIGTSAQLKSAILPTIAKVNFIRNHKVLWGTADWLKVIPVPDSSEIPRHDLVSLIMNRVMEQLWISLLYLRNRSRLWQVLFHSVKAVLDMALVQLIIGGRYEYRIAQRVAQFSELLEKEQSSTLIGAWPTAGNDVEDAIRVRANPSVILDASEKNGAHYSEEVLAWWLKATDVLIANVGHVCRIGSEDSPCLDYDALKRAEVYFGARRKRTVRQLRSRILAWRNLASILRARMLRAPNTLQCARLAFQGLPVDLAYRQGLLALVAAKNALPTCHSSFHRHGCQDFSTARIRDEYQNWFPLQLSWNSPPAVAAPLRQPTSKEEWIQLASQAVLTWDLVLLGGRRYANS